MLVLVTVHQYNGYEHMKNTRLGEDIMVKAPKTVSAVH